MANSDNYKVGYGKPPQYTQFRKGQSGNPNGRPKGSRSIGSIVEEVVTRRISVTEGGRTRHITLLQAAILQLANGAAKGDRHARRELLQLAAMNEARQEAEQATEVLHPRDHETFDSVLKRLARRTFVAPGVDSKAVPALDRDSEEPDA